MRIPNGFFDVLDAGGDWELTPPHRRQGRQAHSRRPDLWERDRLRGLGLRGSRRAVRHHDQRVAHLPRGRADQRLEPVLGVHVPRRHGLQPRLDQPGEVPARRTAASTSRATATPCRLWTVVLEISVLMAAYPSPSRSPRRAATSARSASATRTSARCSCARGSPTTRRRRWPSAGALTAIITGEAYATSAEMARTSGRSRGSRAEPRAMLRVIRNHRRAAYNAPAGVRGSHHHAARRSTPRTAPRPAPGRARNAWDRALALGEAHGYRNAQVTVLAPTGTIGLVMDCDTTGIEPDFALVKFKKLAGGGYFKIINQSLPIALARLGYHAAQIDDIVAYCVGRRTLRGAPYINHESARAPRASTTTALARVEAALDAAFDLSFAFNRWTLGEGYLRAAARPQRGAARGVERQPPARARLHRRADRGGQRLRLRHDDGRGRAAPARRPPRRLRLRQPLRQEGPALHRGGRPHPDDGGGPAVPLRRHQQDDQHARRRHGRRTSSRPTTTSWRSMLKAVALYRDGSKLSQPPERRP